MIQTKLPHWKSREIIWNPGSIQMTSINWWIYRSNWDNSFIAYPWNNETIIAIYTSLVRNAKQQYVRGNTNDCKFWNKDFQEKHGLY